MYVPWLTLDLYELDPIIIIASMSAERSLFVSVPENRDLAQSNKQLFNTENSDHIASLGCYQTLREYSKIKGDNHASRVAKQHSMHFGAFRATHQTAQQIEQTLIDAGLIDIDAVRETDSLEFGGEALNLNSENMDLVKCLLLAGSYPNLCVKNPRSNSKTYRTALEDRIVTHPGSVNYARTKTDASQDSIYFFTALARSISSDVLYMRQSTLITPLTALLFGGHLDRKYSNNSSSTVVMDKWLPFVIDSSERDQDPAAVLMQFRDAKDQMLNGVFRSLSSVQGGALIDDPVTKILVNGLLRVLELYEKQNVNSKSTSVKPIALTKEDAWAGVSKLYRTNAVADLYDL